MVVIEFLGHDSQSKILSLRYQADQDQVMDRVDIQRLRDVRPWIMTLSVEHRRSQYRWEVESRVWVQ